MKQIFTSFLLFIFSLFNSQDFIDFNTVGFPLTKVILIGSEIQPVAVSLIKIIVVR